MSHPELHQDLEKVCEQALEEKLRVTGHIEAARAPAKLLESSTGYGMSCMRSSFRF